MRLSEHDASALLAFVSELRELEDPMPFSSRLVVRLQTLIAADSVCYSECDPVRRRSILQVWHEPDGEDGLTRGNEAFPDRDLWQSLRDTHPLFTYRRASGDWTTARKVSDFMTLREFRGTAMYDAFYRGVIDHWLDVGLAPEPARTRLFIFTRHGRPDFDERDRLVATLLQPHLAKRAESAEVAQQAAASLAATEEGATDASSRVVLCSPNGVIEFASAASRALLQRYVALEGGRIPAALLERREWRLPRDDRRLHIRIAKTDTLRVLILDERDLRTRRLTTRERQILELVAVGKENEVIALELGIAPATVAKHLEHAYRKLGVRNRTAAAALLDRN